MPKLGIDDSSPASSSGVPRSSSKAGIRKATPLMKMNALAVTSSETTTIDQRRPALSPTAFVDSVVIDSCCHANDRDLCGNRPGCADPQPASALQLG